MKNYSLIVALFVLLVVSVSFADPMPVPEDVALVESDEVEIDTAPLDVEVEPTKYYNPLAAGLGNLVPGLGYFLIDEPWWGAGELALCGAGVIVIFSTLNYQKWPAYVQKTVSGDGYLSLMLMGVIYLNGIIHAPLLADYKNEQQKIALDLSPGVGLDSEGEAYPTVQLTLSF